MNTLLRSGHAGGTASSGELSIKPNPSNVQILLVLRYTITYVLYYEVINHLYNYVYLLVTYLPIRMHCLRLLLNLQNFLGDQPGRTGMLNAIVFPIHSFLSQLVQCLLISMKLV